MLPKDAKITTTRWGNVPEGDEWKCRFVAREFRHDDPEMEGLYTSGSTAATGRLVDRGSTAASLVLSCDENCAIKKEQDAHCTRGTWDLESVLWLSGWKSDPSIPEAVLGSVFLFL